MKNIILGIFVYINIAILPVSLSGQENKPNESYNTYIAGILIQNIFDALKNPCYRDLRDGPIYHIKSFLNLHNNGILRESIAVLAIDTNKCNAKYLMLNAVSSYLQPTELNCEDIKALIKLYKASLEINGLVQKLEMDFNKNKVTSIEDAFAQIQRISIDTLITAEKINSLNDLFSNYIKQNNTRLAEIKTKKPELMNDINKYLVNSFQIDPNEVAVERPSTVSADKLVLTSINFSKNSFKLETESYPILDDAAKTLLKNPDIKIEIQGYTDNTEKQNKILGKNRAEIVKMYLIGKGVAESRISTTGYGSIDFIADNKSAEGRAINRRIEFKVQ